MPRGRKPKAAVKPEATAQAETPATETAECDCE